MRRDTRRRIENQNWWEDKRIVLSLTVAGAVIAIILFAVVFSKNANNNSDEINPNQIISLVPEEEIENNTESASSSIGNKVDNTTTTNNTVSNNNTSNTASNTTTANTTAQQSAKETAEKITKQQESKKEKSSKEQEQTEQTNTALDSNKNVLFDWPVKGDILKAYSGENLLFSSTLQEWTVHNGIDIKADKATAVSAVADGTVKSIKNDPRYGLTVTIEHSDGLKTIYSNLLTAEFVVEGEKVSKGQTIGTVGNTANFEIADDFHLHFEVMKDNEYVDPMIYLK